MMLLQMAFEAVYQIMNIPIDVLGYSTSFMEIAIYIIIASMIVAFIIELTK